MSKEHMPPKPSLPLFDRIIDDLQALLNSDIKDGGRFASWLGMLSSDIYGKVLGVNLFVDLRNGCLDISVVANIINSMPFPESVGRRAFYEYVEEPPDGKWEALIRNVARRVFYEYVEEHQDQALFRHLDGPRQLEDDQYVRILPISDVIEYYLRKPLGLSPLIYEAEQEVMERFFDLPEGRRERLGIVTEVWRGRMSNVWVTSMKAVQTSIADPSICNIANNIRDRLGLSGLDNGTLMYIVYPTGFDRARTYVPTTLDSHFGSVCYLSTRAKTDWGLTHCLDPENDGLKERVHEHFDGGLTDEFEMRPLDDITTEGLLDLDHLMNEALKRV